MFCSLQSRNVWTKLPAVVRRWHELQGASLLPAGPLRLLLRQRLVREPLREGSACIGLRKHCFTELQTAASRWLSQLCSPSAACYNDMYGPDCKVSCGCQNGGVCNRFSGCQCPSGWRGRNCQKPGTTEAKRSNSGVEATRSSVSIQASLLELSLPDWAPQILDLEGNLERNLNSSPKIYCSATGNPLPSHNSIELRKPDGSVLKVQSHPLLTRFKETPLTFSVHMLLDAEGYTSQ